MRWLLVTALGAPMMAHVPPPRVLHDATSTHCATLVQNGAVDAGKSAGMCGGTLMRAETATRVAQPFRLALKP